MAVASPPRDREQSNLLQPEPGPWLNRFYVAFPLLLAAYALFNKAMAWVHVPGTPMFVGEIVLGLGILGVLGTPVNLGATVRRSAPLVALTAYMGWGLLRMLPALPTYQLDALRDSAMWYYGTFALLMVLMLGHRSTDWLADRYARFVPVLLLWLPAALVLTNVASDMARVPDSSVSIFSHHASQMAIHAILATGFIWTIGQFHPRLRKWRGPLTALAMALVMVVSVTSRASLVSSAVGAVVLLAGLRESKSKFAWLALSLVSVAAAVGILFQIEVQIFSNERSISVQQIADNVASIVTPDRVGGQGDLVANRDWRTELWGTVLNGVMDDAPLVGYGFGVNLRDKFGFQDDDPPSRHPHSSHVNVMARTGIIGAVLWVILWGTWFRSVFLSRRHLLRIGYGSAADLALLAMVGVLMLLLQGAFDEIVEGPHMGIWLWSLFGLGAAISIMADRLESPMQTRRVRRG